MYTFNKYWYNFRALGMGGTRGRIYIKHAELFKVLLVFFWAFIKFFCVHVEVISFCLSMPLILRTNTGFQKDSTWEPPVERWWGHSVSKTWNNSPKNLNMLNFVFWPQAIQDLEVCFFTWPDLEKCSIPSLAHQWISAVNGCRQNESPNSW